MRNYTAKTKTIIFRKTGTPGGRAREARTNDGGQRTADGLMVGGLAIVNADQVDDPPKDENGNPIEKTDEDPDFLFIKLVGGGNIPITVLVNVSFILC